MSSNPRIYVDSWAGGL